ncbi:hypothetical protein K437DRAFT_145541 [Tilletiaria anomala UBC 951]|uniref:Uncharacterized protein n=1 Tax=Tilletiaria anomala (strain ATCC 24038 / CBS 436.72 / UBC 951) TaxID=1037660 RepID=A0A066VZI1_TILAU|nr:uncharacterized protein K437DRAFT_145541 [Tilletiaria anomala UBC 951]KDN43930.1 hypothetical protein K437DRAFT_145541 [Tilletiaria anomala UBC 951]
MWALRCVSSPACRSQLSRPPSAGRTFRLGWLSCTKGSASSFSCRIRASRRVCLWGRRPLNVESSVWSISRESGKSEGGVQTLPGVARGEQCPKQHQRSIMVDPSACLKRHATRSDDTRETADMAGGRPSLGRASDLPVRPAGADAAEKLDD